MRLMTMTFSQEPKVTAITTNTVLLLLCPQVLIAAVTAVTTVTATATLRLKEGRWWGQRVGACINPATPQVRQKRKLGRPVAKSLCFLQPELLHASLTCATTITVIVIIFFDEVIVSIRRNKNHNAKKSQARTSATATTTITNGNGVSKNRASGNRDNTQ